ncbi:hypothetical protein THS27_10735 [Thalassospira sp. MCCC 1A01428]|nr:hypothetical protein THS27_10735 [Thalassospira sp. MCCC 1A01428]
MRRSQGHGQNLYANNLNLFSLVFRRNFPHAVKRMSPKREINVRKTAHISFALCGNHNKNNSLRCNAP